MRVVPGPRVGPSSYADARRDSPFQARRFLASMVADLVADVCGHGRIVEVRHEPLGGDERRYHPGITLQEELDGFVVQVGGVFDRINSGAERILDPLGAVGVGGDAQTSLVRLLHRGAELGRGHRGRPRCTLLGYDPAGSDDLERPGAALDLRASPPTERVGAVDLPAHEVTVPARDG